MLYFIIYVFAILSSGNAQSVWEWRNPFPQGKDLKEVAYVNNQFIAVNYRRDSIFISLDGETWTASTFRFNTRPWINEIIYGNNQFIAVGSPSQILTSPDGVTWTKAKISGTHNTYTSVTYGNNQFIAVGFSGTILSSKADNTTGLTLCNLDRKHSQPLSITNVSNRLFIQIPHTEHVGNDLRGSLFNAAGRTVYTTSMKMMDRKLNFPIVDLSWGVYHVKITSGKNFEYSGSVTITR